MKRAYPAIVFHNNPDDKWYAYFPDLVYMARPVRADTHDEVVLMAQTHLYLVLNTWEKNMYNNPSTVLEIMASKDCVQGDEVCMIEPSFFKGHIRVSYFNGPFWRSGRECPVDIGEESE